MAFKAVTGCQALASKNCEKYLNPPNTTDFGILFLPIGLVP